MKRKNQTNISLLTLLPTFFWVGGGWGIDCQKRKSQATPESDVNVNGLISIF